MPSRYAALSRDELSILLPELLLLGQLIDRAGMPWCIREFGQDGMTAIAIDEWAGASPIYTRRMQKALQFEGDDVITIFKGLQLDIGAPPQFMDFRYWIDDPQHGGFELAHCGALLDVEPMGDGYVTKMCHDIEDPTFDATAVATNPKARMRPIHRPPRTPSDRHPHCAWTVTIDDDSPEVQPTPELAINQAKRAATIVLDDIDPGDEGQSDYSGDLVSDLDFTAYSRSALVRLADEVCLQMHLLHLSFVLAVEKRATDTETVHRVVLSELVGHAGVAAERLHRAFGLGTTDEDAARVLELHPMTNPAAYVDLERDGATVRVRRSAGHDDAAWISLCGPSSVRPLQAIVRAVDPYLDVVVEGTDDDWTATVVPTDEAAKEFDEVAVTKYSLGAAFEFERRESLPLFVV